MGELGSMSTGFPNEARDLCQLDAFGQDSQHHHHQHQQQQQVSYNNYNSQSVSYQMPAGADPYHQSPQWVTFPFEEQSHQNQMYMLQIIEEPISKIRFRYQSERGSHGSMSGRNSTNTQKSWPTVRFINCSPLNEVGEVRVRASLYTEDRVKPHVHKLLGKNCNQLTGDCILQLQPDLTCSFPSLGVLFTEKKRVQEVLLNRKIQEYPASVDEELRRQLSEEAKQEAKDMKLNSIRIRFQAYNKDNMPITEPVFSEPVHNLKSPDSGELKITRLSRCTSKSDGGDEVFLLCEKVNKKDIKVRFFEQNEDGQETWSDFGKFSDSDVHHQVAIVFQTPAYRDKNIDNPVKVHIQLFRQNDGETSEALGFTYKPRNKDPDHIHNKRKRFNDTDNDFTRFGDHQDYSNHQQNPFGPHPGPSPWTDGSGNSAANSMMPPSHGHNNYTTMNPMATFMKEFAEELRMSDGVSSSSPSSSRDSFFSANSQPENGSSPLVPANSQSENSSCPLAPARPFGAADVNDLSDPSIPPTAFQPEDEENQLPFSRLLSDPVEMDSSLVVSGQSFPVAEFQMAEEGLCSALDRLRLPSGDRGQPRRRLDQRRDSRSKVPVQIAQNSKQDPHGIYQQQQEDEEQAKPASQGILQTHSQDVQVRSEPRREVSPRAWSDLGSRASVESFVRRQMIPCFGRSLRLFTSTGKVQSLLWALAPFLASQNEEGDNSVHLAVIHQPSNQSLFEQLMPVVNSLMPYNIINHTNNNYQSPLHLAVAVQEVNILTWLLLSGADPNLQDIRGNTPFHLAVLRRDPRALSILLDRSHYKIHSSAQPLPNINLLNYDGHSALHLAVLSGCRTCLDLLMDSGGDVNIRSGTSGRTPLHMAVEMQSPLIEELLKKPSIEVDAQDYAGNSPLHLACSLGLPDVAHALMRAEANPLARNFLHNRPRVSHSQDNHQDDGHLHDNPIGDDDNDEDDDDDGHNGQTPIGLARGDEKLLSILRGTLTEEEMMSLHMSRRRSREEMQRSEAAVPKSTEPQLFPKFPSKGLTSTHSQNDSGYSGDSGVLTQESCFESKEEECQVGVLSRLLDPPSTDWEKLALVVCEEEVLLSSMRKLDPKPTLTLFKKIKERGLILKDTLDAAGLSDIWDQLPDSQHKALNA